MVKEEYPEEDIESMRSALTDEEWKVDRLLPDKWKFKRPNKKNITFLSREGKWYIGTKQARIFIAENYEASDLENFDMFGEIETIRRRCVGYDWKSDDPTVPPGWKSRHVEGKETKCYFLSPDGLQFSSRRAALQNLIKEDADTEEVERMRTLLRHEGFQSHKLLPDRWYFREASTQATTNYQILTDDGEIFDSFLAARDFK